MPEPGLPFDPRDLVTRLPELLEGREPALADPNVRDAILGHPVGRQYAAAAVRLAAMLERGPTLLRRARDLERVLGRTARRRHSRNSARALARLGFDVAVARAHSALQSRTECFEVLDGDWTRFEGVHTSIADGPAVWRDVRAAKITESLRDLESAPAEDRLRAAFQLMRSCDELLPGKEELRYWLHFEPTAFAKDTSPNTRWLEFARTLRSDRLQALALLEAAHEAWRSGDANAAHRLSTAAADRESGVALIAYNRALYACVAQEPDASALVGLNSVSEHGPGATGSLRKQMRADRSIWREIRAAQPRLFSELEKGLAPALSESLREAME